MPRNRGTSRKGKPKKHERESGMGRALQRNKHMTPKSNVNLGIAASSVISVGLDSVKTKPTSILEIDDVTELCHQVKFSNKQFSIEREQFVILDTTVTCPKRKLGEEYWLLNLTIPRRPAWDKTTSIEELNQREQKIFLEWRRKIMLQEEEMRKTSHLFTVSPFEKNLEIWRQLWRVLEKSQVIVQIIDARNPMLFISDDLCRYAEELKKPCIFIINKSDFLTKWQRTVWHSYFQTKNISHFFFSAKHEQDKLDENKSFRGESVNEYPKSTDIVGLPEPLTREQLLHALEQFSETNHIYTRPCHGHRIQFGMVGFPNVGKSSVINVLVRSSASAHDTLRVGVASQPGKTKHFQTLPVPDKRIVLCDCPGLVFPSFLSSTADLIVSGVCSTAHIRDPLSVIEKICQKFSRNILEIFYSIHLPYTSFCGIQLSDRHGTKKSNIPPATAEEFLDTYCRTRSVLCAGSGVPDYHRASRVIVKDFVEGKLLFCHSPPLETWTEEKEDQYNEETQETLIISTEKLRKKLNTHFNKDINSNITMKKCNEDKVTRKHNSLRKQVKRRNKMKNSDPYGCQSQSRVDESIEFGEKIDWENGIFVNAGKYGRNNYTRPNYTGARAAVDFFSY